MVGRFVLFFVVYLETKRFCLVYPEGKGMLGGLAILVEKLRAMGVVTRVEAKT